MRFDRDDFSSNVQDHGRGSGGGGFGGGGLGMLLPLVASRFGIGGIVVLVLLMAVFGGGLGGLFGGGGSGVVSGGGGGSGAVRGEQACRTDETKRFACNVHRSTEQVWTELFAASGEQFRSPGLNFFDRGVNTGCGGAESAMGPFYCPADQGIYLDTSFFAELASPRYGASGDFAQAYVIAHEMGHHIQNLAGTNSQIRRAQQAASEAEGNALQVRMELQADCLAGVWAANVARSGDQLAAGDMQEGLRAAQAIGDDTLQEAAGRRPVPESFTHGTSAQRQQALQRGYQGASYESCASYTQGI